MWITFKTTTKANDTVGCSDSVNRKLAEEGVASGGRNVEGSKEGGKRGGDGARVCEDENVQMMGQSRWRRGDRDRGRDGHSGGNRDRGNGVGGSIAKVVREVGRGSRRGKGPSGSKEVGDKEVMLALFLV